MQKAPFIILLTLSRCILATGASAAGPQSPARVTNDRDHDLINALILDRQFVLAAETAEFAANLAPPSSDAAARWALRRSEIEMARRRSLDDFSDLELKAARKPITDFLAAHPDHRRKRFLELAALRGLFAAAEHDLLAFLVNTADVQKADRGLRRLTRLSSDLQELQQQIRRDRIERDSKRTESRKQSMIVDLDRLSQQTLVELLRAKLLLTERFVPGSNDRLAAATAAVDAADEALIQLPDRSEARLEVEKLRIVALERMDHLELARSEWNRLSQMFSVDRDPRMQATAVRIDLRDGELAEAKKRLAAFYNASRNQANASIDIDLVRLEYLIAVRNADDGRADDDRISQWIEEIGDRHGAYGRRRAEAMLLSSLQRSNASSDGLNPSVVASRGRQLLRQDQPLRAAQMLARAASVTQSSEQAISWAIESAAAYAAAQRPSDAATILMQTAVDHPDMKQASAAHLQSTILAADSGKNVSEIESQLQETIAIWPQSIEAQQAAHWLIKILKGDNRILEAAETATRMLTDQSTVSDIDLAIELWEQTLRESENEALRNDCMVRLKASFDSLLDRPEILDRYNQLAVYCFDRSDLLTLDSTKFRMSEDEYQTLLFRFRRSPTTASPLTPPPEELQDIVTERLMRDGRQDASIRRSISQTILRWPQLENDTLAQAERQVWAGQLDAAILTIEKRLARADDRAQTLSKAARVFGQSNDPSALRESVRRWDQLAGGLKIGSEVWHQAKLEAIERLKQLGENEECQKRANYILLTSPPSQPELEKQYGKFLEKF